MLRHILATVALDTATLHPFLRGPHGVCLTWRVVTRKRDKQRMKPNEKNNEISYHLGRRVADLRHRAGICQEKLAKVLGLGQPSSISNREQGITDFTPWELSQLSRHFGVSIDFLVLGKSEKTSSDETSKIVQQIGNLARECTLDRLVMLLHLSQSAAEASRVETNREKEAGKQML